MIHRQTRPIGIPPAFQFCNCALCSGATTLFPSFYGLTFSTQMAKKGVFWYWSMAVFTFHVEFNLSPSSFFHSLQVQQAPSIKKMLRLQDILRAGAFTILSVLILSASTLNSQFSTLLLGYPFGSPRCTPAVHSLCVFVFFRPLYLS